MTLPAYPAARIAANKIQPYFRRLNAAVPDVAAIESLIDAGFWASLRREEGYSPKISLAFLPPERAGADLTFERHLPLRPETLVRLAAAAERPGIHLGVWPEQDDLVVWGATRIVPAFCFILEVVAPGLLVIKHRRHEASAKFLNVAVLEGDNVKILDLKSANPIDCPSVVSALLGFTAAADEDAINVLVELAVSMRAHGRGGALLMVPSGSDEWRESAVQPIAYSISPPFSRLTELLREEEENSSQLAWQKAFHNTVESIAGLTSVDGATVINDRHEVLAFGVKIRRRQGSGQVEQVILTEPIEGATARTVTTVEIGGTRHLSAAQFSHDQRDAVALVASQDGRFTVFAWSACESMVHAHRVETLLL